MVEFSDFQCPYCKQAAISVRSFLERYPGQITFVYRTLALHKHSFDAAIAGACAHEQNRFLEFHDTLFSQSAEIGTKALSQFAGQLRGLDLLQFDRWLNSDAAKRLIAKDTADGRLLKLAGTPTFVINGKKFAGDPGPAAFDSIASLVGLRRRNASR